MVVTVHSPHKVGIIVTESTLEVACHQRCYTNRHIYITLCLDLATNRVVIVKRMLTGTWQMLGFINSRSNILKNLREANFKDTYRHCDEITKSPIVLFTEKQMLDL